MKYTVYVTPGALSEIEEAYQWLSTQTEMHAPIWHNGLLDAISSLEESPFRCPKLPDDEDPIGESRQLLYGRRPHEYRIIYVVRGTNVYILEVVHGARSHGN
jgi:toxin ParE1/3/4